MNEAYMKFGDQNFDKLIVGVTFNYTFRVKFDFNYAYHTCIVMYMLVNNIMVTACNTADEANFTLELLKCEHICLHYSYLVRMLSHMYNYTRLSAALHTVFKYFQSTV